VLLYVSVSVCTIPVCQYVLYQCVNIAKSVCQYVTVCLYVLYVGVSVCTKSVCGMYYPGDSVLCQYVLLGRTLAAYLIVAVLLLLLLLLIL
jgi:hypothetical protein